ncbi:MAG: hypothetical protein JNL98_15210, partial [Bryobacterales bacterium]|nr:hypothetical protein [Bryobacterales bacterium]
MNRRSLLSLSGLSLSLLPAPAGAQSQTPGAGTRHSISLDGPWQFRLTPNAPWRTVTVPHTWQTEQEHWAHYGEAWYQK